MVRPLIPAAFALATVRRCNSGGGLMRIKPKLVESVMSEQIVYGGCLATRREVYEDCIGRGLPVRCADRFAFLPAPLAEADPRPNLTLAQVREWEANRLPLTERKSS